MSTHIAATASFASGVPRSTVDKNRLETEFSASAGHSMYQSIVQQLMSDGNWRHRERNASPTGDMHRMMCRLSLTRLINVEYKTSFVAGSPKLSTYGRMSDIKRSFSSCANRPGTSPLLRMLFMSSTNDSVTIIVSVNKKTVGVP
eukprot:31550-Pelagococcus_subviridis.AAC.12